MGGITAASRIQGAPATTPSPSTPSNFGSTNPVAGSTGPNPFGLGAPDLTLADPNILNRLDISNLIYSAPLGGYITRAEQQAGNFHVQGGDPTANRTASQFYNYIGSLPTANRGSPALMKLSGGNLGHGPSYNSILGNFFNTASPFVQDLAKKAGFGPTYGGPYNTGGY